MIEDFIIGSLDQSTNICFILLIAFLFYDKYKFSEKTNILDMEIKNAVNELTIAIEKMSTALDLKR